MNDKHYSLLQLNALVRESIEEAMPDEYWVEAELSEVRESRGHCYMELIEKSSSSTTPVAKASAKCWRSTWMMLAPYFERITGQPLHAGLKVLLRVYPQFHENYGFSWIVSDIDPRFTMGDMARKRQEIIQKLKEEGVFDLQKQLELTAFAKRIAVVSSATAAGYGDFCNQLADNDYGFVFATRLFPAIMQGEGIERSVIGALDAINAEADDFDAVVIIRGGGATSDLSGFDTLSLAENVANFPLPVITGIGHDRDESVLDMISHTRVKTPTAAAAFLIDNLAQTWGRIVTARQKLGSWAKLRMEAERLRLAPLSGRGSAAARLLLSTEQHRLIMLRQRLVPSAERCLMEHRQCLDMLAQRLSPAADHRLQAERQRLQLSEQRLKSVDPEILLRRGYSITLRNGRIVKSCQEVKEGDVLETRLKEGTIYSVVGNR